MILTSRKKLPKKSGRFVLLNNCLVNKRFWLFLTKTVVVQNKLAEIEIHHDDEGYTRIGFYDRGGMYVGRIIIFSDGTVDDVLIYNLGTQFKFNRNDFGAFVRYVDDILWKSDDIKSK